MERIIIAESNKKRGKTSFAKTFNQFLKQLKGGKKEMRDQDYYDEQELEGESLSGDLEEKPTKPVTPTRVTPTKSAPQIQAQQIKKAVTPTKPVTPTRPEPEQKQAKLEIREYFDNPGMQYLNDKINLVINQNQKIIELLQSKE